MPRFITHLFLVFAVLFASTAIYFVPPAAAEVQVRFAFNWRGAWSSATRYIKDDLVRYQGSTWKAVIANTNQTPTEGSYWTMFAQKGETGGTNIALRNILDQGADPTGVADSYAAFNTANSLGGSWYVPSGVYKIGSTLTLTKARFIGAGWNLAGSGDSSVLRFSGLGSNPAIKTTEASTPYKTIGLENLYIIPNSWDAVTGCTGYGLDLEQKISVKNCYIAQWKKSGAFLHHSTGSQGPYQSLFERTRFDYNGQHGVVVGTGANAVTFLNCEFKWNGATAYGVAPAVAGNYDGLHSNHAGDGNPGSTYPNYAPENLTVIGGDASYNSRYGWGFQQLKGAVVHPGYAEGNLASAGAYEAYVGVNCGTSAIHFTTISGGAAAINLDNANIDANQDLLVTYGGRILGSGNSTAQYYGHKNLHTFLARKSDGTSYVVGFPSGSVGSETGQYNIAGVGPAGILALSDTRVEHAPGTATAGTAPQKFTAGTHLTTPEAGAVEYDGTYFYDTPSATRLRRPGVLTGSATWDVGNLVDGAGETSAAITVTGATLGDHVVPSAGVDIQGITATAWVESANNVKIRAQNETGGAIDLASTTWRVMVFKQ